MTRPLGGKAGVQPTLATQSWPFPAPPQFNSIVPTGVDNRSPMIPHVLLSLLLQIDPKPPLTASYFIFFMYAGIC